MQLYDPSANAKVADINTVPQDFRFMYKQDGDSHVLDAENPAVKSSLSIFSSLKNVVTKTTNDLKAANGRAVDLSPLADFGQTPAEIAAAFTAKVEELTSQIKGADPKKIAEGVENTYKPKLASAEKRSEALKGQLYNVLVMGESMRALKDQTSAPELALPFIQKQVKVVETNGEFQVHVVDENGETRFSGTSPMGIPELVKEMKGNAKYARLFDSEAPAGTGRPNSANRSPAAAAAAAAAVAGGGAVMSATQKIAAGLAKGLAGKTK